MHFYKLPSAPCLALHSVLGLDRHSVIKMEVYIDSPQTILNVRSIIVLFISFDSQSLRHTTHHCCILSVAHLFFRPGM